jgi:hypothetical protein
MGLQVETPETRGRVTKLYAGTEVYLFILRHLTLVTCHCYRVGAPIPSQKISPQILARLSPLQLFLYLVLSHLLHIGPSVRPVFR